MSTWRSGAPLARPHIKCGPSSDAAARSPPSCSARCGSLGSTGPRPPRPCHGRSHVGTGWQPARVPADATANQQPRAMPRVVIVDVDGVVSPVHPSGTTWGDEVVAGQVFGPVLVSPRLCAHLDALDLVAGV